MHNMIGDVNIYLYVKIFGRI